MITISILLLSLVVGFYFLAFVFYLSELLTAGRKSSSWGGRFLEIGFVFHTFAVFVHAFTASQAAPLRFYLPVTTVGAVSGFFAWSLAFIYLVLVRRLKTEGFGLILVPVLVFFLIPAFFPFRENELVSRHFHDLYFLLHILSAFFGFSSFALSFIAGALYWVQDRVLKKKIGGHFYHKFPYLEDLERFVFRTIFWGVLLLVGAILTGALWTKSAFGTFFLREPKALASVLTWCVYLVIIYLHEVSMIKGKRLVLMSVGAFLLVLFTFWGTSVLQIGPHLHAGVW